jgi:hypothetical protein
LYVLRDSCVIELALIRVESAPNTARSGKGARLLDALGRPGSHLITDLVDVAREHGFTATEFSFEEVRRWVALHAPDDPTFLLLSEESWRNRDD